MRIDSLLHGVVTISCLVVMTDSFRCNCIVLFVQPPSHFRTMMTQDHTIRTYESRPVEIENLNAHLSKVRVVACQGTYARQALNLSTNRRPSVDPEINGTRDVSPHRVLKCPVIHAIKKSWII